MLKMIASDMDGSLLNSDKELPADFYEVFQHLRENGIHFVVASGRSYPMLREIFSDILNDIYFVCDNGASVYFQDQLISVTPMQLPSFDNLLAECDVIPEACPILCGVNGAYLKALPEQYGKFFSSYFTGYTVVESYSEIQDQIIKIAMCDLSGQMQAHTAELKKSFEKEYSIIISGDICFDIMKKGVHKGGAIQMLQKRLGVSKDETMAFGDYYNDVEMLHQAHYSFVMENANEDMKPHGRYIAQSNDAGGVTKAIRSHLAI